MAAIPLLRPGEVVKAFERLGWRVSRQKGSHIIMTKEGEISSLAIPNHSQVARGTLRGLLAKSGLTLEGFLSRVDR
jgi:predicted RNA binding protein YcfA (HicA-like mRNA interferase family)